MAAARPWSWPSAAGLVLGLAVLTKGLVGVALVGITYGSYLILSRRLTLASCMRGALTLVMVAVVASTWYFARRAAQPGIPLLFLCRAALARVHDCYPEAMAMLRGGYYLPVLLAGGMPWISYLPTVVWQAWANWRYRTIGEKARELPGHCALSSDPTSGARGAAALASLVLADRHDALPLGFALEAGRRTFGPSFRPPPY